MEPTIAEIRCIIQRLKEMDIENERLVQRLTEILELDQGARKSSRKMLSDRQGKALFAGLKRMSYERSKAR